MKPKTHCIHGHELSGDNVVMRTDDWRPSLRWHEGAALWADADEMDAAA